MDIDVNSLDVVHNKEASRFEIHIDGLTALIDYRIEDDTMIFPHTETPPALGGHGIASKLTKHALDYAVEHNYKIKPYCWFVVRYIERHPEYQEYS